MIGKSFMIALVGLAGLTLAGCGDSSTPTVSATSGPATAAAVKPMQIGLIVLGTTSDGGWNQLAWDDLQAMKKDGAEISKVEKVDTSKAAGEMRDYASRGYDLVIGHGFEYANPAVEAAKDGGKTKFVVSGCGETKPGIMTLDFDLSQPCYQLGIVAAKVSKSGKLGFIGGEKIPSLEACLKGFTAGAKSVKPDISVVAAYTSWDEPGKNKSQAEAFFQQGVDVIFQNVDAASRGVFEAVKEHNAAAGASPVYVFGSNSDQNDNSICGAYTLGSAVIRLDKAFAAAAASVKDGTFKPVAVMENLGNGVCVAVLNPKLVESGVISKDAAADVEAAGKKLVSGEIK